MTFKSSKQWAVALGFLALVGCDQFEKAPAPQPVTPPAASYKPVEISELGKDVEFVTAGYNHTCATLKNGKVFCWGDNSSGQLGTAVATESKQPIPVEVMGVTAASGISLAANRNSSCAISKTGDAVLCWGDNRHGQLGHEKPEQLISSTPVQVKLPAGTVTSLVGNHFRNCTAVGESLHCWGMTDKRNKEVNPVTGEIKWVHMPPRDYFAPIVMGPEKEDPEKKFVWRFPIAIALLEENTCALLDTGISCLGAEPANDTISTGVDLFPRVTNEFGMVGGARHACVIAGTVGDRVACWGDNQRGQLGQASTGTPSENLVQVKGLPVEPVVQLASSTWHTCALFKSGAVYCWGWNFNGQCATGYASETPVLTGSKVPDLDQVRAITAGNTHTCAHLADGAVKCWGNNEFGQIGTKGP